MSMFDETEYDDVDNVIENLGQQSAVDGNETLDEAVARIEEANLWKTLYSTEVFPPGSARDSIRNRLNGKLKSIALEEIQVLLGMRQVTRASMLDSVADEQQKTALLALSTLDAEQISALIRLANKVLQRPEQAQSNRPENTWTPKVQTIQAQQQNTAAVTTVQQKAVEQKQQPVQKKQKKKGQTVSQTVKPIPHAPAEVLIAQGAIRANPAVTGNATAGELGKALGSVIQQITQGNILHVDNNTSNEGDDVNERF